MDRRITALRKMALLCAALVLAITSLSAFLRLSRAGLGCEPWPQCYGQSINASPEAAAQPVATPVALARLAHRVTALAALVVIVMMVMTAWLSAPILWREGAMALGLLALALFLAVLGRWTADARVPAVVLGNLLAGFAMFALTWRLALATLPRPSVRAVPGAWVALAVVVLVAQIALGGLSSAAHVGISCPELARCDLSAGSWQALNPWHAPLFDAAAPTNAAGALLAFGHRAASLAVLIVLLPLGIVAWRRGRRAGAVLVLLLLVVEAGLGALLVLAALPLALALAHNLVAALMLALVVGLDPGPAARCQENAMGSPAGSSARYPRNRP
jgi:cytochrome c oxidase assembly protein subunit 15